jgi:hypothetical protein
MRTQFQCLTGLPRNGAPGVAGSGLINQRDDRDRPTRGRARQFHLNQDRPKSAWAGDVSGRWNSDRTVEAAAAHRVLDNRPRRFMGPSCGLTPIKLRRSGVGLNEKRARTDVLLHHVSIAIPLRRANFFARLGTPNEPGRISPPFIVLITTPVVET